MSGGWLTAGASHGGYVRTRNEDAWAADAGRGLFLVADGLGGHRGGAVASALARDTVVAAVRDLTPTADSAAALSAALRAANAVVRARGAADPTVADMGTTLTVVLAPPAGACAAFGHVGDSRLYRLRAGRLEQISHDQTAAMRMVRQGLLDESRAPTSPYWHLLEQAVGITAAIAPEIGTVRVGPGDRLLLCSDGLTDMLSDAAIAATLAADAGDPAAAARSLIRAALAAGGHDNVSVVVALRQ